MPTTDLEENKIVLDLLRQQKRNLEKIQLEQEKIKIFKQTAERTKNEKEEIEQNEMENRAADFRKAE